MTHPPAHRRPPQLARRFGPMAPCARWNADRSFSDAATRPLRKGEVWRSQRPGRATSRAGVTSFCRPTSTSTRSPGKRGYVRSPSRSSGTRGSARARSSTRSSRGGRDLSRAVASARW